MSESNDEQVKEESGDTANQNEEARTFTQEEVNEIVQKRIARFSDYETLKTERDDLAQKVQSFENTLSEVHKESATRIIAAESTAIAAELKFHYPSDAAMYVSAEDSVDENGNVDKNRITEQLRKLAEERPALIRSDSPSRGADIGLGTTGTAKPKTTSQMFADVLSR